MEIRKAYVDTSIGQLHYRHAGSGEPLLLLHQTPSASEVFEPIMRLLGPGYSMVAVDTPGFGMSAHPPHTYAIPDYAAMILEFLDALQIASTSVLGVHTGATIACELAAGAPHRVNKLIAATPMLFFSEEERTQRLEKITPLVLTEDGSYLRETWEDFVGRQQGDRLALEIKNREITWRLKAGPRYIDTVVAVYNYDLPGRAHLIQAPTLILAGDLENGLDGAKEAARLINRARFHPIPGGRNWLEIEKCKEVARLIGDFIADPQV